MKFNCHGKEDEILNRLCGEVTNGFYIDIGANSSTTDSVTKHFYDKGWTGINVEPVVEHYIGYLTGRTRDINLVMACGEQHGFIEIYVEDYLTKGLSTAVKDYAKDDWKPRQVPVTTLTAICDYYVKDRVIDFLKIDVEGFEANVIKGMDWQKYRPRVLCIEATKPCTTIDTSNEWEHILTANGYTYVENNVYNKFYKDTK